MKIPNAVLAQIVATLQASPEAAVTALLVGDTGATSEAASTLGRSLGREVRRVDLRRVVSRSIGETEKNLDRVFADADGRGVVLLFDEADALFGKRTAVSDAHDRFANSETAYLLSRMEQYSGLAILASNMRQQVESIRGRLRYFVELPASSPASDVRAGGPGRHRSA